MTEHTCTGPAPDSQEAVKEQGSKSTFYARSNQKQEFRAGLAFKRLLSYEEKSTSGFTVSDFEN